MSAVPVRVVDAHVHFWDPARTDWYPFLSTERAADDRASGGMFRRFGVADHLRESLPWSVDKVVHVAGARPPFAVEETRELEELAVATGHPAAIIASIDVHGEAGDSIERIEELAVSTRFRGVRATGDDTGVPPAAVLHALDERGLVLDLMVRADRLTTAAATLDAYPDLTVVVEHAGWPRDVTPEGFRRWQRDLAVLAAAGDQVHCKISGLAMALGSTDADALRPWVQHCLEVFGADRCFFASNFPVESAHGTFDDLYTAFLEACSGLSGDQVDGLFAGNAERVYRC